MYWFEQLIPQNRYDWYITFILLLGLLIIFLLVFPRTKKLIEAKLNGFSIFEKLHKPILIIISLCVVLVGYMYLIEPNLLQVREYEFDISEVAMDKPIKVIVVGDLQYKAKKSPSYVNLVIDQINAQDPDLILWVGDLIESNVDELRFMEPFKELKANYGKYAVLGNHDYGYADTKDLALGSVADQIEKFFEDSDVTVLRNEMEVLKINNYVINLAGTDDEWAGRVDFSKINPVVESSESDFNLLMIHEPRTLKQNDKSELYSLVTGGHCHGRQVSLSYLNKITDQMMQNIGCILDNGKVTGFLNILGHNAFITPGVGVAITHLRFMSPPEISVVNLY